MEKEQQIYKAILKELNKLSNQTINHEYRSYLKNRKYWYLFDPEELTLQKHDFRLFLLSKQHQEFVSNQCRIPICLRSEQDLENKNLFHEFFEYFIQRLPLLKFKIQLEPNEVHQKYLLEMTIKLKMWKKNQSTSEALDGIFINKFNIKMLKEWKLGKLEKLNALYQKIEGELSNLVENYYQFMKEKWYPILKEQGMKLKEAPNEIKNSKESVLIAIQQCGKSIKFIGNDLKDKKEIAKIAIRKKGENYKFLSEKMKSNYEIAEFSLNKISLSYKYFPIELKENPDLIQKALNSFTQGDYVNAHIPQYLYNDRDFVLRMSKSPQFLITKIPEKMRSTNLFCEVVKNWPSHLFNIPNYTDNIELIKSAIMSPHLQYNIIPYIPSKIFEKKQNVLDLLALSYRVFKETSSELKKDEQVLQLFFQIFNKDGKIKSPKNLLPEKMSLDPDILKQAITENPGNIFLFTKANPGYYDGLCKYIDLRYHSFILNEKLNCFLRLDDWFQIFSHGFSYKGSYLQEKDFQENVFLEKIEKKLKRILDLKSERVLKLKDVLFGFE
eukprot:gene8336-160_t